MRILKYLDALGIVKIKSVDEFEISIEPLGVYKDTKLNKEQLSSLIDELNEILDNMLNADSPELIHGVNEALDNLTISKK